MTENEKNNVALFRYGIIAPLITGNNEDPVARAAFFKDAAEKFYNHPYHDEPVNYSVDTIRRYYKSYKEGGFDALKPSGRKDVGTRRVMSKEVIEAILYFKKNYPKMPATLIRRSLLDNGTIIKNSPSLSTITRFINTLDLDVTKGLDHEMKRYECPDINMVWCGDSSVGPYLKINGKKKKTWIIALLDDASRYIVGIDIFFEDNYINLMAVIRSAVIKYGKPKKFNFDNGSNYKCNQMNLLAARMGSAIYYNPPRYPEGKAKIERWFKTLKSQWMPKLNMNDYKSLEELRDSLFDYVQEYNQSLHSSLDNMSPQDRFFLQSELIIRIPDEQVNKIFLLEVERRVSADGLISLNDEIYEVDSKYARQKLLLRYSPDLSKIYSVDKNTGEYEEIHLLNKQNNSTTKRKRFRLSEEEQ